MMICVHTMKEKKKSKRENHPIDHIISLDCLFQILFVHITRTQICKKKKMRKRDVFLQCFRQRHIDRRYLNRFFLFLVRTRHRVCTCVCVFCANVMYEKKKIENNINNNNRKKEKKNTISQIRSEGEREREILCLGFSFVQM